MNVYAIGSIRTTRWCAKCGAIAAEVVIQPHQEPGESRARIVETITCHGETFERDITECVRRA